MEAHIAGKEREFLIDNKIKFFHSHYVLLIASKARSNSSPTLDWLHSLVGPSGMTRCQRSLHSFSWHDGAFVVVKCSTAFEGPAGARSPCRARREKRWGDGRGPLCAVVFRCAKPAAPCSSPMLLLFMYMSKRVCNSSVKGCDGPMACQAASSDSRVYDSGAIA